MCHGISDKHFSWELLKIQLSKLWHLEAADDSNFWICEYRSNCFGCYEDLTTPGTDQDTWDMNNREATMLLKLFVAYDQDSQIPFGKTAAKIWALLKGLHDTSDKSRAFFLKNTLFSIIMDEWTPLQAHLNRMWEIHDQLLSINHKMEEEDIVVITLQCLPKSYEHFIETLNITSSGVDLKFTDLYTLLLQQDQWKQQSLAAPPPPPQSKPCY